MKYTSLNGTNPQVNDLVTIDQIKKVSAGYGMICETMAEIVLISDYNWKPALMARRISYDKNS